MNVEVRPFSITLRTFHRLTVVPVACYSLLVVTGGAVRLTGSGLGCPDWPSCTHSQLTAALSLHPMVEFGNRLVTVAVSVLSIAVFLAALALRPRRRDLIIPATGLLVGLAAQIVLGGLVVLFSLNPYLVALHFVLTFAVLADAIVLWRRAGRAGSVMVARVSSELVWLARLQLAVLVGLICVGTLVTGAGPHAGAKGTKRIPIAFRDIAELHSTIALFLIGLTLASLFALHLGRAPGSVQRLARLVLEVYAIQGVLGFTQYFLHDAALVVEFHLLGATAAFVMTLRYYFELFAPMHADSALLAEPLEPLRAASSRTPA